MHDVDLSQRLLLAESDFLTALESGTKFLSSYQQTWSALSDALSTARKTASVGDDTFVLVNFVASRISNIASCLLDIKREEELSTSQLRSDCDAMLRQMDALDLDAQPTLCALHTENSPPILTYAYQWLLDNLQNPYPTAEAKAQIATASSCQVSSVNSWFINARRRIGWTTLCRERFSSCKADMIDAAYRALVEEDPQNALSPELRHSFVTMKVAAEGLYSSAHTKSALVGNLDAMVKDVTGEDGASTEVRKCNLVDKEKSKKAVYTYPSPHPSSTTTPVPTLADSLTNENEGVVVPPMIAGFKRRRSSIEPVHELLSTAGRPIKRLRSSVASRTCLPSPPSSADGVDDLVDRNSPELSVMHSYTPHETNRSLQSLKRCLSGADATGIRKHPNDPIALHPHTVSDVSGHRSNVESECSIDDWFKTNFDDLFAMPPPVDAAEPDFTAPWEVELFQDYNIPDNMKYTPKYPPANPCKLSDLDGSLTSISGDATLAPPDSVLLSTITGTAYTSSLDSSALDVSQANIDWSSLLSGTEVDHPRVYPTIPHFTCAPQLLPEIDLSVLQLPQDMPAVHPEGNLISKQAKLYRLHAMQEVVWKMEQELRSEGVVI